MSAWKIVAGRTVKADGPTVEVEVVVEVDEFACPECERVYKTERGRDNHLASAH